MGQADASRHRLPGWHRRAVPDSRAHGAHHRLPRGGPHLRLTAYEGVGTATRRTRPKGPLTPEHDPNTTRTEASPGCANVGVMNTDTRRTTGLKRTSTALGGAVLLLGSLALGACSKTDSTGTAASAIGARSQQAAGDSDTVDLVDAALTTPAVDATPGTMPARPRPRAPRTTARACAPGCSGPCTARGSPRARTARSPTRPSAARSRPSPPPRSPSRPRTASRSPTPSAADTKVRERSQGKGVASTIGAVKVGAKALVTGVGATNPTARLVVFKVMTSQPAASPSPSATS